MSTPPSSPHELKQVMDELFTTMSDDLEMGPALRDADEERCPHLVV